MLDKFPWGNVGALCYYKHVILSNKLGAFAGVWQMASEPNTRVQS
jgi:hypothetical protein